MNSEIYEDSYKNKKHFSFGKNWQIFLKTLNDERVEEAKKSLINFLGGEDKIKGKSFIDIGCGSGIFSLVAYLLGAKKIVCVDVDEFSVSCAEYLKQKKGNPKNWEIIKGSALDEKFINSLGHFDIVYSWGVLHHTGKMYEALKNVAMLVEPSGVFYLAIYNNNTQYKIEGTSRFWAKAKRTYNNSNLVVKKIIELTYTAYYFIGLAMNLKNPITYIKSYSTLRGMSFRTDIKDWLGGHPYEYATVDEITDYFEKLNFKSKKINRARSIGCNEFLLKKI